MATIDLGKISNLETVKLFRNDIAKMPKKDIQALAKYFNVQGTDKQLPWLIAIKIAKKGTLSFASGPNNSNMIFLSENERNENIDDMLRKLKSRNPYLDNISISSNTKKNEFKAFLIKDDAIIGYAKGKYITKILDFTFLSTLNHLREAVVSWIQIIPEFTGKGYCLPFMKFILTQLRNVKDYNKIVNESIEVINTGGVAGCKCYVKAAEELQGVGVADVAGSGWRKITINDCNKYHDKLNFIAFKESPFYHI